VIEQMKKVIELCLKIEEQRICSLIEENERESERNAVTEEQ
jgi:hypothetical protein